MKTLPINGKTVCFVPDVPKTAFSMYIDENGTLLYWTSQNGDPCELSGFAGYTVLGFTHQITEEMAKGIVEIKEYHGNIPIYKDHVKDGLITKGDGFTSTVIGYDTALRSFHSFLKVNGIGDGELVLMDDK
jgi:hypothetical protein